MNQVIKKILFTFCLLVVLFAVAHFALAADLDVGLSYVEGTGLGVTDPRIIAARIIRIALGFLGIIAVGLIIYAGWLWMTAEGEAEKVEKAKKILIGAVIGLAICLASFAIASFILSRLLGATGATGDGSVCDPPCSSGQYCCNNSCSNSPCGSIGGGGGGGNGNILPGEGQACLTDLLDTQCAVGRCAVGLSCSGSSCTCEKENRPGQGQSCDADSQQTGCQAKDCASDLVCSADNNCTCIKTPLIAWISPVDASNTPNGAVGNFITIGGQYFGATPGKVIFLGNPNDNSDDKEAVFPISLNPACENYWQDGQIVVVVPAGAKTGPIKVLDATSLWDTTDNNRGPAIKDFLINDIKRPGVCLVNPDQGFLNAPVNLQGNGFNGASHSVLFGSIVSSVAANNIANWTNLSVDATVPNIREGRNSVFIKVNNIDSNSLSFMVKSDAARNPTIEYIEPSQGPIGQYITIYGRNFKTYNAQKSSVKFYLPADPQNLINADIDFPQACQNNWWHDTYIIVKVPKVNTLGAYKVVVTNNESKTSLPADFTINNKTPSPGLCLLDPNNGPVSQPVSASGERFGSSQGSGRIQYFNNKDGVVRSWNDKKVDSNVPNGAVNGPVRIINGQGNISNPLPFKVGKCSTSAECDTLAGEECCGSGTYWSGICRDQGTCSQGSPIGCGFGWTFSTKSGQCSANQEKCDILNAAPGSTTTFHCCARDQCNKLTGQCDSCPDNKPDQCDGDLKCCSAGGCKDLDGDGKTECSDGQACSGYSTSQCNNSYFCPNSPGKCSTYGGGAVTQTGSCDYSCNNFSFCQTNKCAYDTNLNKCALKNQTCNLSKIVKDADNNNAVAQCVKYNNQNRWQLSSKTVCPAGWTNIGGGKCIENNSTCQLCGDNFKCAVQGSSGICAIDQTVCPAGSICGSNNKCTKIDSASCECCCRIGHSSEDCCSPLECEGKCGSDRSGVGTNTYGSCTGCGSVGSTQSQHNAACNCSGTSGKFCLIDSANPTGVCQDCAQIAQADVCSGQGVGVCCVDAKNNNACRGGQGQSGISQGGADYGYCPYYKCDSGSCANTAVATSSLPNYQTLAECNNKCASAAQLGNTCFASATSTQSCDINKCTGFACINEDGSGPAAPQCGTCCCNPYAAPDSCKNWNSVLVCQPNQTPCSGDKRGLCCGCSRDSECGSASSIGCGADTCCHARPSVITTVPANGASNICRNGLIQAVFDQPMQVNTFTSNVIVAGYYGLDQCPANTKYLTAIYKPTFFARVKFWLAKIPVINKLFISEVRAIDGNFCAVPGVASGYITADKKTVLEFRPQQVLEANRKYYVIIKGDADITDAINNGVLSQFSIGLGQTNSESFNGVSFKGKIWSFTTKEDTATNNGICLVNYVTINPAGYLFNTAVNNPTDDDAAGSNYDTVRDGDKVFRSTTYSLDKQPVMPIENVYNWKWDWAIDNKSVVKFKNGENALDDSLVQTLVAQNVKEANTLVHTKAAITQDTVNKPSTVGAVKDNAAQVYVFLCANPWPWFKDDGSWEPWRDTTGNCLVQNSSCANTNFELYYCRDAGQAGTADDLPAILSDKAVIRGSSAEQNILKEFYFFREGTPNVAGVNLATTTNETIKQGSKAGLTWQAITLPSGQILDKYLVYYGTKSGSYEQSLSVIAPGTVSNPVIISNLTNGVKYYFAVTARYNSGAESSYSNETNFIPADNWAPQTPQGLAGTAGTGKAVITWQANQDDTAMYKVYYGATSGSLGASVNLDKSKCSATTGKCEITISNLTAGVTYYFAATALDLKANESSKSGEIHLIIE